jgi:penicillin amidase
MAAHFAVPASNLLAADRGGSISVRSTGRFPLRPGDGSGAVVRDGSTRASDWTGDRPVARYPQAADPAHGYLASANQQPVDPAVDSGYLALDTQFDPWRALRINQLLRADSAATPDAMRRYQTDPGSALADHFAPAFLRGAAAVAARGGGSEALDSAARRLAAWDRRYTRENEGAVLFEAALRELARRTWDELAPTEPDGRGAVPSTAVLARLLDDSASVWWDHRETAEREDRDAVLAASVAEAYAEVVREHGPAAAGGWRWSRVRHANVPHLLRIPGFSALDIPVQGGRSTLSPTSGDGVHGASWRMVVELGPEVRAWGIYPGGQTGNPGSAEYTSRLARWAAGELDPLVFPRSAAALGDAATSRTVTLRPPR